MQGKIIDYENNYCLYEYFDKNIIKNVNSDYLNRTAIIYKNKSISYAKINETIIKINKEIMIYPIQWLG